MEEVYRCYLRGFQTRQILIYPRKIGFNTQATKLNLLWYKTENIFKN